MSRTDDRDAATTLDSWLKCKIHEEHLMKFDWVVVLVRLLLQLLMLSSLLTMPLAKKIGLTRSVRDCVYCLLRK